MRIVYESDVISQINKLINDAVANGKAIKYIELNDSEIVALDKWYNDKFRGTYDAIIPGAKGTVRTYMGVIVKRAAETEFVLDEQMAS